jgi:hypothetical protein
MQVPNVILSAARAPRTCYCMTTQPTHERNGFPACRRESAYKVGVHLSVP